MLGLLDVFDLLKALKKAKSYSVKILCYSPYNIWQLHGLWEVSILHRLHAEGHEIEWLFCDGLYKECDFFWGITRGYPRPEKACEYCQQRTTEFAYNFNLEQPMDWLLPYGWLGKYSLPDDFKAATAWSEQLTPDAFLTASYQGHPLGDWVRSSNHSHFRQNDLDFTNPVTQSVYRGYLYSAVVALKASQRAIEASKPDRILLFNGRMSNLRVFSEVAKSKQIPFSMYESGMDSRSIMVVHNRACSRSFEYIRDAWQSWHDIPLSEKQLQQARSVVNARFKGTQNEYRALSPPIKGEVDDLFNELHLDASKPVWLLMPSSEDEFIAEKNRTYPFERQNDWIEDTLRFVSGREDVQLIIRAHPNIGGLVFRDGIQKQERGANQAQYNYFLNLKNQNHPNVRVIMPEEQISSYGLMDICTLGLTLISTVAYEMACKGKLAICAAAHSVAGSGFVWTMYSREAYPFLLQKALFLPVRYYEPELARIATRFVHFVFCYYSLYFPLVTRLESHGEPNFSSLDELLPGRDLFLDRIARIVLFEEETCPPPDSYDQAMDTYAEDLFFLPEEPALPVLSTQTETPAYAAFEPRITVVIEDNQTDTLRRCIQSLQRQTLKRFDILVWGKTNQLDYQRLIKGYPDTPICFSFAPTFQELLDAARGESICFLQSTMTLGFNALETLTNTLMQHPKRGFAYPRARTYYTEKTQLQAESTYTPDLLIDPAFMPWGLLVKRYWIQEGDESLAEDLTTGLSHKLSHALRAGVDGIASEKSTVHYFQKPQQREVIGVSA